MQKETEIMELPLEWDSAFQGAGSDLPHTESIPDALILSLGNLGRVDIGYIMDVTGAAYMEVVRALRGAIYQNPERFEGDLYKGWETAEEYLSGNLRQKLRAARKAGKTWPGRFGDNVFALRKLLPEAVAAQDIYVTLGSPWVPCDVVDAFIRHMLRITGQTSIYTKHDEYTGSWDVVDKYWGARRYFVAAQSTYGTPRMSALEILEKTLNMKNVAVYDEISTGLARPKKKRVLNQSETLLAVEKQQKQIAEFQRWVWTDPKRRERLESIFESRYGCVRRRVFDGSFLTFPGMSEAVQMRPYQKNAVARILFSPNTLLAHDVGSGKTYVMIAAGMELKRMGLSQKNLYVVPNNIVGQWREFFAATYPDARVLCVEGKSFTPARRAETLRSIRDGEWDAVIMAYSTFERIPISKRFRLQELQEAQDEIREIEEDKSRLTAGLKKKKEQLIKAVHALIIEMEQWGEIYFDDLGFTRIFVDEAHNFKNVPIETKIDRVLGISASGSKKCKDMMDKVHFIQKQNGGGGVVMATGTPITNSLTDAFVMQMYLQSGELAMLDLQNFDSWIGMFAERATEFEIDVDTNSYRLATRFARFHNLPELTALLSSVADFHRVDECADLPHFAGYSDTLISRTPELSEYLMKISERADAVRGGRVNRKEDNMLKITTDGRKAALDLRLVAQDSGFTLQSKVARCAENASAVYRRTAAERLAQLIFCDSSTPKEGFNVYDELKRLLVGAGVLQTEIAFVHDAATEAQREKLFAKVRCGEIRILIGSTFKLGMGVNVQDKLIALHHLDVPWRPADMTQREGRILRQGNRNPEVYIYRYITEGSFDAYSWQLLETKQRFITELLEGSLCERSGADVEDTVLNYAEVKGLAVGNPLIKRRVEASNELTRLLALRRRAVEGYVALEKELRELPGRIAHQREVTDKCLLDLRCYRKERCTLDKEERKALREQLYRALLAHLEDPSEERVALTYQGFDVLLPAGMSAAKPCVWLCRNGRYYVELGDLEFGAIIRIDNFLDKLSERLQTMEATHSELCARQAALTDELAERVDYADAIESARATLAKIDKKLGVMK